MVLRPCPLALCRAASSLAVLCEASWQEGAQMVSTRAVVLSCYPLALRRAAALSPPDAAHSYKKHTQRTAAICIMQGCVQRKLCCQ